MEKIKKQNKNNKLQIIALTWNNKFELPDSSYSLSNIQSHIEYTKKKHETLTKIAPIHVYISRINNRSWFRIKDGYKLDYKHLKQRNYLAAQKR